MDPSQDIIGT